MNKIERAYREYSESSITAARASIAAEAAERDRVPGSALVAELSRLRDEAEEARDAAYEKYDTLRKGSGTVYATLAHLSPAATCDRKQDTAG